MADLIAKLNALSGKTPDEIVKAITTKGWRKPSELGRDYFADNISVPHVWCCVNDNDPSRASVGGNIAGYPWHFSGTYGEFCRLLESRSTVYWIIPLSEYNQGDKPPCTT